MKNSIIVKTQFEALHCWPDVPENHSSYYLVNPHRHIFHIELYFEVSHLNRDVEFIEMKHHIDKFLSDTFPKNIVYGISDVENRSCEYLASLLLTKYLATKCYKVIVLEDGEMGAVVEL